jgi:carboxyl-terminal processing protease
MNFGKQIKIIIVLALIAASFWLGFFVAKKSCSVPAPSEIDMSLFWQAWNSLEEKFVDKAKIDHQKMIYGAIAGMVKSLGDPYTVFFDPQESKQFIEDSNGSFEGVGMEIGVKRDQISVITPIEGSPAKKAGIRAGDVIAKINGTITTDMKLDEAISMIRGPKGTEVTLTIYRDDWKESRDIKLTRAVIEIPSIKLSYKNNDIAYIQLFQFSEKASDDFKNAALQIIGSSAKKIVLDLRGNPGGYLNVAQDIAGWFLKKGEVVTIEDQGNEKDQIQYVSLGPSLLENYPIVVLIDEGSASASEILAGALRDNRNVQLVGQKSYGKGSVQEVEPLNGGSSLKITIAKWLTPKGIQISEKGLVPDIAIEISLQDADKNIDPQLNKAIDIAKSLR